METANINKELAIFKTQVSKAETAANELQVKTEADLVKATELFTKIKTVGKLITQKKESITQPLNEALKNARAFFSPIEAQWANAQSIVSQKMIDYRNAKLAEAIKKTDIIEKKVESGKMDFTEAAKKIEEATPTKSVETESGKAQFRTIKEVVIEDETKLPREYLTPDTVKIRKVALAGVEIPGVKVVEKQILAGITKI